MGLFGSANVLLRQIFEWLVIGKFCCVAPDTEALDLWHKQESIFFATARIWAYSTSQHAADSGFVEAFV
jgi:hypothetical protein